MKFKIQDQPELISVGFPLTLSTQPYTKSSYPLNLAHFQPVNSTLVFFWAATSENEKIREPEKNFQLSETPYFQDFFGIQFCTFDSNTTHSTCSVLPNISSCKGPLLGFSEPTDKPIERRGSMD